MKIHPTAKRRGNPRLFVLILAVLAGILFASFVRTDSEQAARALVHEGEGMAEQGKGKAEAAIALFDEVERRYGRDATPAVRAQVA
jgi:TolA-binding protein